MFCWNQNFLLKSWMWKCSVVKTFSYICSISFDVLAFTYTSTSNLKLIFAYEMRWSRFIFAINIFLLHSIIYQKAFFSPFIQHDIWNIKFFTFDSLLVMFSPLFMIVVFNKHFKKFCFFICVCVCVFVNHRKSNSVQLISWQ